MRRATSSGTAVASSAINTSPSDVSAGLPSSSHSACQASLSPETPPGSDESPSLLVAAMPSPLSFSLQFTLRAEISARKVSGHLLTKLLLSPDHQLEVTATWPST